MFKKLSICCLAVLSLHPLVISSTAVATQNNPRFQRVQQMFREISANRTIPTEKILWNPWLITDDPFLTSLCSNNCDGNYQNPFNCNEFIMCAGGQVFLWECPADGSYDPIPDLCVYPGVPPNSQCPWPSIWYDPEQVRCDYLGQRLWWSPLAFPSDSTKSCERDIFYCLKYFLLGYTECPEGFGYSKAYLACLEVDICRAVDIYFGLLK